MSSRSGLSNSLRSRQILALRQLLNFNQPVPDAIGQEPSWKVLVFDKVGQDILSPLFTVNELRERGVTLHLQLSARREALPDVSCIYFVEASDDNVRAICQDLDTGLYESYYLNFIGAISRPALEDLAVVAVKTDTVSKIHKVVDQYLSFICLEDDLFTLRRYDGESPFSFYSINRADMKNEEMDRIIDCIVDGLYSVCVTLCAVPIIRCPRGNAAELVAEKLCNKLKDNLRDARNNLFTSEGIRSGHLTFHRPVLIILDRTLDLATPLHHTWTYQALIHDVLSYNLNRVVTYETTKGTGSQRRKDYDLNAGDKFWTAHKGSPFPAVAEAIQEELETYRTREEEIRRLKQAMGLEDDTGNDEAISYLTDATAELTSTVSSLPELLEKKRLIDVHTNLATAVLQLIKARKLDAFFEEEEKIMNRQVPDRPLIDLILDSQCGSEEDKLRIFLIQYIIGDLSENEMEHFLPALEKAGCDISAAKFIRRWKRFSKTSVEQYGGGGTRTVSMFSKLLSQSSQFIMEGVKNLVIQKHNLPVTKIVDSIMEGKNSVDVEDYRYFDPKLVRSGDDSSSRNRGVFYEGIVFIIGGGNYVEYQNLVDYKKNKLQPFPRKITYSSTEMVNASDFLKQLSRLGSEV